jgi:hypothetical protein
VAFIVATMVSSVTGWVASDLLHLEMGLSFFCSLVTYVVSYLYVKHWEDNR